MQSEKEMNYIKFLMMSWSLLLILILIHLSTSFIAETGLKYYDDYTTHKEK